jgi:hypothetical protein
MESLQLCVQSGELETCGTVKKNLPFSQKVAETSATSTQNILIVLDRN